MGYFNIHTHTDFSNTRLLDSINPVDKLIDKSIELGLKGIAITDHGLLSAHVQAEQHMSKIQDKHPDFKLALGNEIYLVDERTGKQKYYHYILVAKNLEGHIQLRELSSLAYIHSWHENMRRIPNTKKELFDIVSKSKGNLIATTACLGGFLPSMVLDWIDAENGGRAKEVQKIKTQIDEFLRFNLDLFGEDFYVETAPSDSPEQLAFNSKVKLIADVYGIKMIFATDAHFLRPEDSWVHRAYLNSKGGDRETESFYKHCYLMTMQEAESLLKLSFSTDEIEQMRVNTLEIYDKIERYTLFKPQVVRKAPVVPPSVLLPDLSKFSHLVKMLDSGSTDNEFFVKTCVKAIQEKGLDPNVYLKRIDEEADVLLHISDRLGQDLSAYMNFLKYYIDLFWEMGSIVGPGRGSAVGFASSYLLGITQVDPIKYELPAFRFLNKGRAELPDIDIDLSPSKKPAIVAELRRLLGELNVLSVATFGTEMARSAVLSACRGYRSEEHPSGIDVDTAQYLTSLIPSERGFLWSLKDVVYGDRNKGRKPNRTFIEEVNKFPRLLEAMLGIEGLVKQSGLHAAGILFFNDDVYETTAIMRAPNGELCSQFSLHDAEFMGW